MAVVASGGAISVQANVNTSIEERVPDGGVRFQRRDHCSGNLVLSKSRYARVSRHA